MPHAETLVPIRVVTSSGAEKNFLVTWTSIIGFMNRGFKVFSVTTQQPSGEVIEFEIARSLAERALKLLTEIEHQEEITPPPIGVPPPFIPTPTPTPTPPPIPPPPEEQEVTQDMVLQNNGVWSLDQDRITGEILYIATNKFNPFFYNKILTSIVQFRDKHGTPILIKVNNLQFFETQRDERLMFDERVGFDNEIVDVTSLVWVNDTTDNRGFAKTMLFTVKRSDPPTVPPPTTPIKGNAFKFLPYALISALFLNSARR